MKNKWNKEIKRMQKGCLDRAMSSIWGDGNFN